MLIKCDDMTTWFGFRHEASIVLCCEMAWMLLYWWETPSTAFEITYQEIKPISSVLWEWRESERARRRAWHWWAATWNANNGPSQGFWRAKMEKLTSNTHSFTSGSVTEVLSFWIASAALNLGGTLAKLPSRNAFSQSSSCIFLNVQMLCRQNFLLQPLDPFNYLASKV